MSKNLRDNMIQNQIPPKKRKNGSKAIIVILIIILILMLGAAGFAVYYLEMKSKITPKMSFFQYAVKGNFSNVLTLEKLNTFTDRFQTDSSERSTTISGDIPKDLLDTGDIDISEAGLKIDSKSKPSEKNNNSDILLTYNGNNILEVKEINDNEKIGITSDEVVVKYLGSNISNLDKVVSKIVGQNVSFSSYLIQAQNMKFEFPTINSDLLTKYGDVINKQVPDNAFSNKEVTLDRDSGKINVTEYSMKLTESQMVQVADSLLQTLGSDDELLDNLLQSLGNSKDGVKEQIKSKIAEIISGLYAKTPDDSKTYTVKVYGAKDVTYKVTIDLYGEYSIDVDYEYGENSNSMKITYLETKSQNGYTIEFKKDTADATEKMTINFGIVSNADITGKINYVFDLVNSGNSYTLKNNLDVNTSSVKFSVQTSSTINFKEVQTQSLTDDNCLYIDQLDDNQFYDVIKAVKDKGIKVISDKLVSQGLEPLVKEEAPVQNDDNTSSPSTPPATINSESEKENSKNKLMNAIQVEMDKANSEGRPYTLDDLVNLEVPDSTFSVSIDGDVANVNIDGFEFQINSQFQLYE